MHCQLRKLQFESPETIDKVFINSDNTIALVDKEGGVRLYATEEENNEPTLITSYNDHKGPVMDASFSSIAHPFYLLTCSYDRSISLRSKEGQVFSYKEEDVSMGFFVCCTFVKTEGGVLRFLVGNSNGYVFDFDSRNGFVPTRHLLFGESVVGIETAVDDCIFVIANNNAPRIYVDKDFSDFVSIGESDTKEKYKQARMVGDKEDASLLLINENGKVGVYRFNGGNREVTKEAEFQLNQKVLSSSWNFSRHSANLLIFNSETSDFQARLIVEDLGQPGKWELVEATSERVE